MPARNTNRPAKPKDTQRFTRIPGYSHFSDVRSRLMDASCLSAVKSALNSARKSSFAGTAGERAFVTSDAPEGRAYDCRHRPGAAEAPRPGGARPHDTRRAAAAFVRSSAKYDGAVPAARAADGDIEIRLALALILRQGETHQVGHFLLKWACERIVVNVAGDGLIASIQGFQSRDIVRIAQKADVEN